MDTFDLAIFDLLPQYIGSTDSDLRFRYVNKAYADFLGAEREVVRGRRVSELWGDEVIDEVLPYLTRALGGERVSFTKRISTKTGERRVGKVELVPDPSGGYMTIIQDLGAYERSIRDRDYLVHELDHRVNNILQNLQSIIALETQCSSDEARKVLSAIKSRVEAMGLSYEHMRSPEPLGGWAVPLVLSRIGSAIGPGISATTAASEDLRIRHSDLDAFIFIATEMARWASMGDSMANIEVRKVPAGIELIVYDGESTDLTQRAGAAGIALVESFARTCGAGPLRGGARMSLVFPEYADDAPRAAGYYGATGPALPAG